MRPSRLAPIGLVLLASCAVGPTGGPPLPTTARSLFDDYLLVHGLAAGTVQNAAVDRDQLLGIIRLDHAALLALSADDADDTPEARARAQQAIEALAAYAATVSAVTPTGVPRLSPTQGP